MSAPDTFPQDPFWDCRQAGVNFVGGPNDGVAVVLSSYPSEYHVPTWVRSPARFFTCGLADVPQPDRFGIEIYRPTHFLSAVADGFRVHFAYVHVGTNSRRVEEALLDRQWRAPRNSMVDALLTIGSEAKIPPEPRHE